MFHGNSIATPNISIPLAIQNKTTHTSHKTHIHFGEWLVDLPYIQIKYATQLNHYQTKYFNKA